MTERLSWSAGLGRWLNVPVRIHLLLILFIVAIFGIEMTFAPGSPSVNNGTAVVTCLSLMAAIVVHEIAHLFANAALGGRCESIILMPWGGNSILLLPASDRHKMLVALAGPFINGCLFALGAWILINQEQVNLMELTNPFRPHEFDMAAWQLTTVKIFTWVNFQIFFVNIIPCFSFDGAAFARAMIGSWNFGLPIVRTESAIMVMGHAVSFTLIGFSLLIRDYPTDAFGFGWLVLLMCGICLLFATRHSFLWEVQKEDFQWTDSFVDEEHDSQYENAMAFNLSVDDGNSAYSQWLLERQEQGLLVKMRQEEEEDRLADDILKKLHVAGFESLTSEERSILHRVSARIRQRREQQRCENI